MAKYDWDFFDEVGEVDFETLTHMESRLFHAKFECCHTEPHISFFAEYEKRVLGKFEI